MCDCGYFTLCCVHVDISLLDSDTYSTVLKLKSSPYSASIFPKVLNVPAWLRDVDVAVGYIPHFKVPVGPYGRTVV